MTLLCGKCLCDIERQSIFFFKDNGYCKECWVLMVRKAKERVKENCIKRENKPLSDSGDCVLVHKKKIFTHYYSNDYSSKYDIYTRIGSYLRDYSVYKVGTRK